MAKKVAVILSGCGYLDGAEVQECVLTLYFLDRAGIEVSCFAPDQPQMHVVNHLTNEPTEEQRNVLVEAARIARGVVRKLGEAQLAEFDALVIPGGYGVAKNLSDFALKGAEASVNEDLVRLVDEAVKAQKPIVAICIAPAVLAAALSRIGSSANLTIGSDAGTAQAIETLGSKHESCPVQGLAVDQQQRIVSTPGYMLSATPKGVGAGIEAAIDQLIQWL